MPDEYIDQAQRLSVSDELAHLRAENLRLSRALAEAYTEVEVTRADRDRLSYLLRVQGQGPSSPGGVGESEVWWPGLVMRVNALRKKLDGKPRELRIGCGLHPGSLLNAYREGDLNFNEVCTILISVEFAVACEALRIERER